MTRAAGPSQRWASLPAAATRSVGGCALSPRCQPHRARRVLARAEPGPNSEQSSSSNGTSTSSSTTTSAPDLERELSKSIKNTAATFAPRPSTATKNPAYKGSVLYSVFEVQAWISMVIGGFLSYNLLFPTDEPSIPRLLGMWSIWMFTIPSLRARECMPKEKDALNLLFVAIPLMNVTLPLVWKSFPFIFTANAITVIITYYIKGVWQEVYGLPLTGEAKEEA